MKIHARQRDVSIDWWKNQELKKAIEEALSIMRPMLGEYYNFSVATVQSTVDRMKPADLETAKNIAYAMIEEWIRTRAMDVAMLQSHAEPLQVNGEDAEQAHVVGGMSVPVTPDGSTVLLPKPKDGWTPLQ